MPRSRHPRIKQERAESPDFNTPPPPYPDTPPPDNTAAPCTCKHQCEAHDPPQEHEPGEKPQQNQTKTQSEHPARSRAAAPRAATNRSQRKTNRTAPAAAPQGGSGAGRERRTARPKPRGRKESSTPPPSRVEKNRSKPRKTKLAFKEAHHIRRILGERGGRDNKEYLVDWLPGWQYVEYLQNAQEHLDDWNQVKGKGHCFNFYGEDVIRCTNMTEDDAPEQYEPMINTVFAKFKEFMGRPARAVAMDLFKDSDWVFADGHDRKAVRLNDSRRITPADVLRRSYIEMRNPKRKDAQDESSSDSDGSDTGTNAYKLIRVKHALKRLNFADIKLCFVGQIDPGISGSTSRGRVAYRVTKYLEPLFSPHLSDLSPVFKETFDDNDTDVYSSSQQTAPEFGLSDLHPRLQPMDAVVRSFATRAPYLLRNVWPLMFTRLFIFSDEISKMASAEGIKITEDWCDTSRDWFLYTYKQEAEEGRAIDHIERTYLKARDEVMEHVQQQYGDDGEPMEE